MYKRPAFHIDTSRCTGCKTCMIACMDKHDLPEGVLTEDAYWSSEHSAVVWKFA